MVESAGIAVAAVCPNTVQRRSTSCSCTEASPSRTAPIATRNTRCSVRLVFLGRNLVVLERAAWMTQLSKALYGSALAHVQQLGDHDQLGMATGRGVQ